MAGTEAIGEEHDLAWWACCSLREAPAVALQMTHFLHCMQIPGQVSLRCVTMRSAAECWSGAARRSSQVRQTMYTVDESGSGCGNGRGSRGEVSEGISTHGGARTAHRHPIKRTRVSFCFE
jgi:hypothetical protein